MIAWWPNKIKAGTTTHHVAAFWDLLPTFAEVAGQKISTAIDGISFYPTLVGEGEQQEHEYLYWEFHEQGGKQAVRQGNWKAVKLDVFKSEEPVLELYDLSKDPGETNNIANDFPEKAQELESLMSSSHIQNPRFSFYRSEKESSE
ncbi:sulfatase/phosphatase domain-containing protein [Algoriphagus halophilus]|uniref:sulfatase/phosphatase domain-containing protein n=1 Tax=Algoriphagus halophilus TaxID=226505 RepID=UPI00358F6AEE